MHTSYHNLSAENVRVSYDELPEVDRVLVTFHFNNEMTHAFFLDERDQGRTMLKRLIEQAGQALAELDLLVAEERAEFDLNVEMQREADEEADSGRNRL